VIDPVNEREHHKKAFEVYYALGEKRNHQKVASKLNVSTSSIKLWASRFNWTEKIQQREAEAARILATRVLSDQVSTKKRNLQIVQMALVQLAKAIADGKVKMTLADLDRLVRLESFLMEGPDSRKEILYHGLTEKSNSELKSLIKEEIEKLRELEIVEGEYDVIE
jgi:transposase